MNIAIDAVNGAGDMGEKLADAIMQVKQIFPGSYLQKTEAL